MEDGVVWGLLDEDFRHSNGLFSLPVTQIEVNQRGPGVQLQRALFEDGLQLSQPHTLLPTANQAQAKHGAIFRCIPCTQGFLHQRCRLGVSALGHERRTKQRHGLAVSRLRFQVAL